MGTKAAVVNGVLYSRLMGRDQDETIERIKAFRQVFAEHLGKSRGRIVNAPGDSILAEFASVQDAVATAVEIQRELAEKNADLPDDKRMLFRIGIDLSDVPGYAPLSRLDPHLSCLVECVPWRGLTHVP